MSEGRKKWLLLGAASLVVLVLGFVGDWFGRTDMGDVYPSDAVCYLDVARAFGRGDWTSALNPLWNQGYPALLALVRPLFAAGPEGVWDAAHWLNLGIFFAGWVAFAWLVRELMVARRGGVEERGAGAVVGFGALCLFLTAQLCIDQVSRVGPDKLMAVFFFLTCGLVVRILRRPGWGLAAGLGLTMGLGFLAKSAFLPLGGVVLLFVAVALRRRARYLLPAVVLFGLIVLGYGAALSRATGWRTLGESGMINYAWHVNRLAKWVHWEGVPETAVQAWPSAGLAQFVRWDAHPPDFGKPMHPSVPVGVAPTIYEFHGPRHATYDPYLDPPYWYRGYHRIFNWRYQVIAIGKNLGHLAIAVAVQPMFWALGLVAMFGMSWRDLRAWLKVVWPVWMAAAAGALLYVPVHLEARYVSAFLGVLGLVVLVGVGPPVEGRKWVLGVLAAGFGLGLVHDQLGGWRDMLRGRQHEDNIKWQMGEAIRGAGLPRGAEVGMISWGANLDADWLNIGEVEVTSEIQDGKDEADFVAMSPVARAGVLGEFQRTGAVAVLTRDEAVGQLPGWRRLGVAPVWVWRF